MLCACPIEVAAAGGIVPCGRCSHCRTNKKLKRKSRLLLEARQASEGKISFITLTYDDAHLPKTAYNPETGEMYESELGTLDPWEFQKFNKKLRQNLHRRGKGLIRFAGCGEYGTLCARPHYHLIVFGADCRDLGPQARDDLGPVFDAWSVKGELKCDPSRLSIEQPRNEAHTSSYICDYLMKGTHEDRQKKAGQKYPEFFRSSQGVGRDAVPALASAMQTDSAWQYIWDHGAIPHTFNVDGKNYLLDSYMRNKILDQFGPSIAEEIKKKGRERYAEEMLLLFQAAGKNPETYFQKRQKGERALAKIYVSQNAQEMKLRDAKYARFNPSKKGL